MKKIYLLALVLIGLSAKAQYFQYLYGDNTNWEQLTDGNNAYSGGGTGHFLVGPGGWVFGGDFQLKVQRTDINGNIGGPLTFNNLYYLSDVYGMLPANMRAGNFHSMEFTNGSGFAIVGSYQQGVNINLGIIYTHMDPNGNIMVARAYNQVFPGVPRSDVRVQEVTESVTNPNNLYITGYVKVASTGNNRVFVLKIDQAGNLLWGATYELTNNYNTDSDISYDIVENSNINPTCNCNEVIVVGEHLDKTASSTGLTDAFVLRVNSFTGSPLQPADFYGTPNSSDVFTSIRQVNNPNIDPANPGFAIAGYTSMGPSSTMDMWFMALDNGGTIAWDHMFDYNSALGHITHDYAFDIIERLNTQGNYEYYLAGYTSQGDFGDEDVLVVKTDNLGNAVTGGQFTYGDVDPDRGLRVDQLNGVGPDADGIAVYAYSWNPAQPLGGYDHYLVKAYFNGVTACQYDLRDPFQNPGSAQKAASTPEEFWPNTFNDFPYYVEYFHSLQDYQICWEQNNPDGSNARIAPAKPKGHKEAVASPNPMAQGSPIAMVEVESEATADVQVAIYDMLGKQYYNGQFTLIKGTNQLPVDVSNANMATGMYTIKVSGTNINKNILLMVK